MGLAWLFLTTFRIPPSRTSTERIPSSRLRLTRSSITMSLLWLLPRSSRSSLSRGVAPHRPLQFWLFYCARYALRETAVNPFARKAKKRLKKQLKEIRIAGGKFCARSTVDTGNQNRDCWEAGGVFTAQLFTMRTRGFLEAEVTSESTREFSFKMTGLLMSLRKKNIIMSLAFPCNEHWSWVKIHSYGQNMSFWKRRSCLTSGNPP